MSPVSIRYELLDPGHPLSIRRQAILLDVPRARFYYKPRGENSLNLYIMLLIDQQYQRTPFYGVPRMTDYINGLTIQVVNHKRIARLYKLMDLRAIGPNPNTSKADKTAYKYPYLLRNFKLLYPNQVWVADITFIPLKRGFMYLFAIMDLFSRYIIAWDISNSMTAKWCKYVIRQALNYYPTPEIFNTDQGTQFTSDLWTSYLKYNGIQISMDGKGRAIDNIFIERFWRTYKYEYLYINPPNGGKELYDETEIYMNYYNFERQHSSINKLTPAEMYFQKKTYFTPTKYSVSLV